MWSPIPCQNYLPRGRREQKGSLEGNLHGSGLGRTKGRNPSARKLPVRARQATAHSCLSHYQVIWPYACFYSATAFSSKCATWTNRPCSNTTDSFLWCFPPGQWNTAVYYGSTPRHGGRLDERVLRSGADRVRVSGGHDSLFIHARPAFEF